MKLHNEFTIEADAATVWAHLLDMDGVAACLPGAKIEEFVEPNIYKGTIRVRIGPMTVDYRGQATLVEVDDAAHAATIHMRAREQKGQGSAVAVVKNHLETVPGGTRVVAETDLQITGPQAQFGKAVLEDVGGRVLIEFSRRLEEQINGARATAGRAALDGAAASTPMSSTNAHEDDEVLDLGRILSQSMAGRAARLAAAVVAAAALVALALSRRRR